MKRRRFAAEIATNPAPRHGSIRDAHRAALPAWLRLLEATGTVDVHKDTIAESGVQRIIRSEGR